MYGAILGDIIGSPYEFNRSGKTKDFPLFIEKSRYTDDTVMTIAVADAVLGVSSDMSDASICNKIVASMRRWGQKYPYVGYGQRFRIWLGSYDPEPYGSYGNGSAMRISSVGWMFDTIEETRRIARLTAAVTHNHAEGIKGAEATASATFLARTGHTKDEIKDYIIREFGYNLSRTCDEIRPTYRHDESCQGTVPEAITAFLEGTDFEDVIRTAVSLGGDCDTLTCIAGGIAEAFYGVPDDLVIECRKRVPYEMLVVLDLFSAKQLSDKHEFIDQPFRVIIAGTRTFDDYDLLRRYADIKLSSIAKPIEIVSGGARGADALGERYAKDRCHALRVFPADWDKYGKRAGYLRNVQMAEYADALLAFWDGESRGTKNMIDEALSRGLKVGVKQYDN